METYYSKNKEVRKAYQIAYNLRPRNQERIKCECGGRYTRRNKSSHINTFRHYEYLKLLDHKATL